MFSQYVLPAVAAALPAFCALLLGIGAFTLLLQTSASSAFPLAADRSIRGRITSIYLLAWFGGIAIRGTLVGNSDQYLGPCTGVLLAGVLPGIATVLIAARLTVLL